MKNQKGDASSFTEHKTSKEDLRENDERLRTITEYKRALQNEERFSALLNHNPSLLFLKDEEGKYVYLNPAYEKQYALTQDWLGKTDFDFWPKESAELFRENDAKVLKSGEVCQFLEDSFDRNGKRHCWLCYKFPFTDSDGKHYVGGIGIDSTSRVMAEEELKRSAEKYQHLVTHAPTGIYEVSFLTQKFVTVNDAMCIALGYSREELLSMSVFDILDEDGKKLFAQRISRQSVGEKVDESTEYRVLTKNGKEMWVSINASYLYDHGAAVGAQVISHDVTKQRKALDDLKASEEQFRRAIEEAPIPTIMQSEDGQVLQLSRTWTELTGYSIEDIKTFNEWTTKAVYGQGANEVRDHLRELFSGNRRSIHVEFTVRTTSGEDRYWDFSASSPGTLADGKRFIVGMAIDITERKKAEIEQRKSERALKNNERRLRQIYDALNEGMALHEVVMNSAGEAADYRLLYVNSAFEQITGISRNRAEGALASELYGTGRPPYLDVYARVAATRKPESFETEFAPMNKAFHISVFSPVKGQFGTVFSDITERKQHEETLRYHSLILRHVNDAIVGVDPQFRVTAWNRAAEQMYGYTAEEIIGRSFPEVVHSRYIGMTREQVVEQLMTAGSVDVEALNEAKDGRTMHIDSHTVTLKNDQGSTIGFVGVNRDITERKRAEQALRESENIFRDLVEKSNAGVYLIQDRVHKYVNAKLAEIHGYDPAEMIDHMGPEHTIHPDDWPASVESMRLRGAGVRTQYRQFRIVRGDGEIRDVEVYGSSTIYKGRPAIIGTMLDVTDRKRAEEELRKSRDDLELRVQVRTRELGQAYEELQQEMKRREETEERLRQAHKMEALGTLAGGIAHDFNNILGGILGFTEMAFDDAEGQTQIQKSLSRVLKSVKRAKDLVRQILSFSRKADYQRNALSVAPIVNVEPSPGSLVTVISPFTVLTIP